MFHQLDLLPTVTVAFAQDDNADPTALAIIALAGDIGEWRRLASALLLRAIRDAIFGDIEAHAFLYSPYAYQIANSIDLPWPPTAEQMVKLMDYKLSSRTSEVQESDDVGAISLRSIGNRRRREAQRLTAAQASSLEASRA